MLAKGKIFVSIEKLTEILSLPEGVEVIAVKPKGGADEGFEFLVMSAEETVCTKKDIPVGLMRRTTVDTLEKFKNSNKSEPTVVISGGLFVESVPFPEVSLLGKGEVILDSEQAQALFNAVDRINIPNRTDIPNLFKEKKEKTVQDSFKDVLNRKGIF